jgi:ATP synthase protein I
LTRSLPLLKGPRLTGSPAGAANGRPYNLGQQEECVAANEPGQDPNGDETPIRDVRLSQLDARLKAAAGAEQARSGTVPRKPDKGYKQGSRVLTELVAGPAGGALIGWVMDRLFGTSPWLLLVMLALGIIVAFRNIYRISMQRPE